jgi:NADP-dependent 3-hydroxy acid dehydrogenase YdfG
LAGLPPTLSQPPDLRIAVTPRTWLFTGASQGLGKVLAETALERGHSVALPARRVDAVEDLRSRYPDRAIAVQHDVTDDAQVTRAVAETESRFGGVDILVNNAGSASSVLSRKPIHRISRAVRRQRARSG